MSSLWYFPTQATASSTRPPSPGRDSSSLSTAGDERDRMDPLPFGESHTTTTHTTHRSPISTTRGLHALVTEGGWILGLLGAMHGMGKKAKGVQCSGVEGRGPRQWNRKPRAPSPQATKNEMA